MLSEARLNVSMTPELGDALLTLVKHEVLRPTPESESRRRLEFFVLRAETLVARLVERQEVLEADYAASLRREALLRMQVASLLDTLGQVEDAFQQTTIRQGVLDGSVTDLTADIISGRMAAETALETVHEALEGWCGVLEGRIVTLEAGTFSARARRLWLRLLGLLRIR